MESESVNLPKLHSSSVLAVLKPQVNAASCVSVLMSVILTSIMPSHSVWSANRVFR